MRTPHIIGVVVLVAAAAVGGWFIGRSDVPPAPAAGASTDEAAPTPPKDPLDWRARFDYEDKLPDFVDAADGERAPTNAAFGLAIGKSKRAEVERWIADRSLVCKDTSVRALMAAYRDKKVDEIKAAQSADDADGASGASWLYRSTQHEKNPQVRLTCEKVRLSLLGDRERPESVIGRLLFIFDSAEMPLRRVVVQRRLPDDAHADARLEFIASDEAMRVVFGEPAITRNDPPAEGGEFPHMQSLRREWKFADLEAKVSALRLKNGITVYEEIGVPWPVRPDAPVRPAKPAE